MVVDVDLQMLARDTQFEVKTEFETEEGGDVEMLRRGEPQGAVGVQVTDHIGLLLAEGVGDFDDCAQGGSSGVEAVIKADRIENVAQNAGKREHANARDGRCIDLLLPEDLQDVFLHIATVFDDVVVVEEGEEGAAVAFEEA